MKFFPIRSRHWNLECSDTLERLIVSDRNSSGQSEWLLLLKSAVPRSIVSQVKSLLIRSKHRRAKTLQEILVCPRCKGEITWEEQYLHCGVCERHYPIVDGIPRFNF